MSKSYQHYLDACTEAYFRGIRMDDINPDRAYDDYYNGRSPKYTVDREAQHQRYERERRQSQQEHDEYMEQMSYQKQQQYYQSQEQDIEPIISET